MKRLILANTVMASVVLFLASASATVIDPVAKKCPVCDEVYISMDMASYTSSGMPSRDLWRICGDLKTCPHCLYTSFASDFEKLTPTEKEILKKRLSGIKPSLQEVEKKLIAIDARRLQICDQRFYRDLLARECYVARNVDEAIEYRLALRFYYDTPSRPELKGIEAHYRKQAIAAITKRLESGQFDEDHSFLYEYLLGELHRCDENYGAAKTHLQKSLELLSAFAREKPDDEKPYDWLNLFVFEQNCRMDYHGKSVGELKRIIDQPPKKSEEEQKAAALERYAKHVLFDEDVRAETESKIAFETLTERDGKDAWKAIGDHVMQDSDKLKWLHYFDKTPIETLQQNREFWSWLQKLYLEVNDKAKKEKDWNNPWETASYRLKNLVGEDCSETLTESQIAVLQRSFPQLLESSILAKSAVEKGDTLPWLAIKRQMSLERLKELNPQLSDGAMSLESLEIYAAKTPPGWSEKMLLSGLHRLILEKDREACRYFLRWCATMGKYSQDRFDSRIGDCLMALAQSPDLWEMPPPEEMSGNPQQKYLYACLDYVHGNDRRRDELLNWVKSPRYRWGEIQEKEEKSPSESKAVKDYPFLKLVLACLASRHDGSAKSIILANWKANRKIWAFNDDADYIQAFATAADILEIDQIARDVLKGNPSEDALLTSHDVEEILLEIQLRLLLERQTETASR